MIKPPQELIDKFITWFLSDPHAGNEDYYKDVLSEEHLCSLSKNDFINFFTDFAGDGGKLQSGGHRNKNNFRQTITEKYDDFREVILRVFQPGFNVGEWLDKTSSFKYFGSGLATIYLNRVDKKCFSVVNNKTKDALALLGVDLPVALQQRYNVVHNAQSQLIEWFPEFENFYRVDALNHYLVGTDEGAKLAKQLLKQKRYWICGLGEGASYWDECQKKSIAVFGFDELPDLSTFSSKAEITDAIQVATGREQKPTNDALAAWQIVNEIKIGDILIAKRGAKTYLGYGVVTGSYKYDTERKSYKNIIPVNWKKTGEWLETEGQIALKTLTDITSDPDYVQRLISMMDIDTNDAHKVDLVNAACSRKAFNRIYYGPPGTGKTYSLLKLLNNEYTDHQANEDPENWLIEKVSGMNWFQIISLILLEAGQPIKVADIVDHKFYQAKAKANGRTANLSQNAWGYLQRHTWGKSSTVDSAKERRAEIAVFDKDNQSNWFIVEELKEQLADLAPTLVMLNAGPEQGAINKRYSFVTFHQSYGYEEFVEGLRPELGIDATDQVHYEISYGALRKLCARAVNDPDNFYAMVIDEINRGNISKIFGELITLIEIDKRDRSPLAVPIALPYSGDAFIIPPNVDFIGSMNTADRSLALVDTALRRRFEFFPVLPDPQVLAGVTVEKDEVAIDIQKLLVSINSRIEALYDRDHTIGHAYFTHIKALSPADRFQALKSAFQNKIIPLLEEYFFEDWQKIRLVLGDNQKEENFQFIKDMGSEEDLVVLFGQNHELDQYAIRARFRLNRESLDRPQAYVGVYAPVE